MSHLFHNVWYATPKKMNSRTKNYLYTDRGSLEVTPNQIRYQGMTVTFSVQNVLAVYLTNQAFPWVAFAIAILAAVVIIAVFNALFSPRPHWPYGGIIGVCFGFFMSQVRKKWVAVEYKDETHQSQKAFFTDGYFFSNRTYAIYRAIKEHAKPASAADSQRPAANSQPGKARSEMCEVSSGQSTLDVARCVKILRSLVIADVVILGLIIPVTLLGDAISEQVAVLRGFVIPEPSPMEMTILVVAGGLEVVLLSFRIISWIGLYRLRPWSRWLYLGTVGIAFGINLIVGLLDISFQWGFVSAFASMADVLAGAILAVAFISPASSAFEVSKDLGMPNKIQDQIMRF